MRGCLAGVVFALLALAAAAAPAEGVAPELDRLRAAHDRSRTIQRDIDRLSGASISPLTSAASRQLAARIRATEEALIEERQRVDALAAEIRGLQESEAGLIPLLEHMLDSLTRTIQAGPPFDRDARLQAVLDARAALSRHDLAPADRYATVLAAWLAEIRYGYTSQVSNARIDTADGQRLVQLLRVGRVGLYTLSPDGTRCELWLSDDSKYAPLAAADCRALTSALANQDVDGVLAVLPVAGAPP